MLAYSPDSPAMRNALAAVTTAGRQAAQVLSRPYPWRKAEFQCLILAAAYREDGDFEKARFYLARSRDLREAQARDRLRTNQIKEAA